MAELTAKFELLSEWVKESRELLATSGRIIDPSFRVQPLIVELIGMGGAEKSHFWTVAPGKYFGVFVDCGAYQEPQNQIMNVSKLDREKFLEAEQRKVKDNLQEALRSVKDLVLFDRGLVDFLVWLNLALKERVINEDECIRRMKEVMDYIRGKVDLVFVHIGKVETCTDEKLMIDSLPYVNSFCLQRATLEETAERFLLAREMYIEFFLKDTKMRSVFKRMIEIDVDACGRDFRKIFRRMVVVINLYLVFKAWESVANKLGTVKIEEATDLLNQCCRILREKMKRMESEVKRELNLYKDQELIVGVVGGKKVILKGIGSNVEIKAI